MLAPRPPCKNSAMLAYDLDPQLDNPIWSCLTTRHAHLALGHGLARRYPPTISPLAGLSGQGRDTAAILRPVVEVGDDISIFGPVTPTLGANWETLRESRITQMIRMDDSLLPEGDVDALPLVPRTPQTC